MGGIPAIGTIIARGNGDGPPETFTDVANVVSISGVPISQDLVDTTTLDAVDGYESAVPTVTRTGETTLGLNFDPGDPGQTVFLSDIDSRTKKNFRITFSDTLSTQWNFAAFVTGFEVNEINPEGKLEATVTLKIDGKPTFS